MTYIQALTQLMDNQAFATYVTGFGAVSVAVWQFKKRFVSERKIVVFNLLSEKIDSARKIMTSISASYGEVIKNFAETADKYSRATAQPNESDIEQAKKEVQKLADLQVKHLNNIYDSFRDVLEALIEIERNTLISDSTKKAARHLYYLANKQHEELRASNDIIPTIYVVTPGGKPNISPDTFNKIDTLLRIIANNSSQISNYLDDLRVVLHNDLVSRLFKKANYSVLRETTLTPDGLVYNRASQEHN